MSLTSGHNINNKKSTMTKTTIEPEPRSTFERWLLIAMYRFKLHWGDIKTADGPAKRTTRRMRHLHRQGAQQEARYRNLKGKG